MTALLRLPMLIMGVAFLTNIFTQNTARAQDWSKIDCAQGKVSTVPMDTCFHGPASSGMHGNCFFEQFIARGTTEARFVYAHAFITKLDEKPGCWVVNDENIGNDLKTENSFLKSATNWSGLLEIAGTRGMRFDFPKRKCFVYLQHGPQWGGGFSYDVRAHVCGPTNGTVLTDAQIAEFIASVKVKQDRM
jgi:hypothetical protein